MEVAPCNDIQLRHEEEIIKDNILDLKHMHANELEKGWKVKEKERNRLIDEGKQLRSE